MDSIGSVVGALVATGLVVGLVLFIVATTRNAVAEQREMNALARARREAKPAGQRGGGKSSSGLDAFGLFATERLKQTLVSGDAGRIPSGRDLLATDGMLHTYEHLEVDWKSIWSAAAARTKGIPPFGVRPYWTSSGPSGSPAPFSMLAFWGVGARLQIANDPTTDRSTLAMIAGDQNLIGRPDPRFGDPNMRVQTAAAKRL